MHARGITGRGVGIAVIDSPLLVGHEEYATNIDWYEEIDAKLDDAARMHAAAGASIAVGRTIGVAPGARLFFIGVTRCRTYVRSRPLHGASGGNRSRSARLLTLR